MRSTPPQAPPLLLADGAAGFIRPIPIRNAFVVVGMTGLLAIGAKVSLSLPGSPVPLTLQTLALVVGAAALGAHRAVASCGLYLLVGGLGFPVFASAQAGVQVILGPTGGYLLGFLPAAYLVGHLAKHGADRKPGPAVLTFLAGHAVVLAVGVPWLAWAARLSWERALEVGLYPVVSGAGVKSIAAGLITVMAWRGLSRSLASANSQKT